MLQSVIKTREEIKVGENGIKGSRTPELIHRIENTYESQEEFIRGNDFYDLFATIIFQITGCGEISGSLLDILSKVQKSEPITEEEYQLFNKNESAILSELNRVSIDGDMEFKSNYPDGSKRIINNPSRVSPQLNKMFISSKVKGLLDKTNSHEPILVENKNYIRVNGVDFEVIYDLGGWKLLKEEPLEKVYNSKYSFLTKNGITYNAKLDSKAGYGFKERIIIFCNNESLNGSFLDGLKDEYPLCYLIISIDGKEHSPSDLIESSNSSQT